MMLLFTEIEYYALSKKKSHMISKIINRIKTKHRQKDNVYMNK